MWHADIIAYERIGRSHNTYINKKPVFFRRLILTNKVWIKKARFDIKILVIELKNTFSLFFLRSALLIIIIYDIISYYIYPYETTSYE